MMPLYIDTENVEQSLNAAATELQARFAQQGAIYQTEDIQKALVGWLELSIEELVSEALFHVAESDRSRAFNRQAFDLYLKRLQPTEELSQHRIAA